MNTGVRTNTISHQTPLSDELIVNRDGSTALQTTADLAVQLAGAGALADAIVAASAGLVRAASLPSLNATAGTRVGQPGEVTAGADKGTYRWSGAAWVRVGDLIDPVALSGQIAAMDVSKADKTNLVAESVLRRTLDGALRGNSEIGKNSLGIVSGDMTEDGRLVSGNEADGSRWDGPVRNGVLLENNLDLIDGARDIDGRLLWGVDRFSGFLSAGTRAAVLGSNSLGALEAVVDLDGRALAAYDAGGPIGRGCVYEQAGDIYIVRGTETIRVTTTGDNRAPAIIGNAVQWISTRRRGVAMTYEASLSDLSRQYLAYATRTPLEVIPATGQSLMLGTAAAISISGVFGAYKFAGGPVGGLATDMPPTIQRLREGSFETISSGLAAALIKKGGVPDLLIAGQAQGGYRIDQIAKGAPDRIYERVMAQVNYAAAQPGGAHARALGLIHGEADALISNTHYAADIIALLESYEADIRLATGQVDSMVLLTCQTSSASGYRPDVNDRDGFTSPMQQLMASEMHPRVFLVGTKYQYDYTDHAHIDALSTRLQGEYYAKVYRQVVIEGRDWRPTSRATITAVGASIVIDCNVPVAPLVIDTAWISDPGNYGFVLRNAGGVTITGVSLTGPKQITIATSGAVPAGAVLSYAFHNGTGGVSGRTAGARGCIRDSDPTPSIFTGQALRNWLCIFRYQF